MIYKDSHQKLSNILRAFKEFSAKKSFSFSILFPTYNLMLSTSLMSLNGSLQNIIILFTTENHMNFNIYYFSLTVFANLHIFAKIMLVVIQY